jgi:hypothetical protein
MGALCPHDHFLAMGASRSGLHVMSRRDFRHQGTTSFDAVLADAGVETVKTPPQLQGAVKLPLVGDLSVI